MDAEPSDAELARLIASATARADQAEAVLFRRFAPRIRLYGRRHLAEASSIDDLVQQVMLRVLEAVRQGSVDDTARLASFVLGVCRNVTLEIYRAQRKQRTLAE